MRNWIVRDIMKRKPCPLKRKPGLPKGITSAHVDKEGITVYFERKKKKDKGNRRINYKREPIKKKHK